MDKVTVLKQRLHERGNQQADLEPGDPLCRDAGEAIEKLEGLNGEAADALRRMHGVMLQLLPGIGKIACPDYKEIATAPLEARRVFFEITGHAIDHPDSIGGA